MNTRPLTIRFWEKVNKNGPVPAHCPELGQCWEWVASKDDKGYGKFQFATYKNLKAHRVAWFIETGTWPKPNGLHRCNNRACVRFSHLYEGTQAQNVLDMVQAGHAGQSLGSINGNSVLNPLSVQALKNDLKLTGGRHQREIAAKYGVSQTTVWQIHSGRTWKHLDEPEQD